MAVLFSADGQDYNIAPSLGSLTNYTVTSWLRLDTDRNTFQTVWCLDNGTTDYSYLQTTNDGVTLYHSDDATGNIFSRVLTLGKWYYWGVSRSGTSYTVINRAIDDTSFSSQSGTAGGGSTNGANFRIGESTFGGEWWAGAIASTKFYSVSLSAAEMEEDYFVQKAWRSSFYCWYPLLQTDTTDYSGNGRTLSGGSGAATTDGPPVSWAGPELYDVAIFSGSLGPPAQTDSVGLTDTTAITQALERTDNGGPTDSVSISQQKNPTDTTGLTDTTSFTQSLSRTDDSGLTDSVVISVIRSITVTDSIGLTDTHSESAFPAGPNITDSAGSTDTTSISQQKNPTDDAGLDDDATTLLTINRLPTDSAGLADSVQLSATYNRTVQDSAGLTDPATVSSTFARAATDDTGLSDSATRSFERPATDSVGLSDDVTRVLHKIVDDSVGLSDTGTPSAVYNRTANETLGLSDVAQTVSTFNRVANDSAGLTEALTREVDKTRDDFLPLTDSFVREVTFPRSATDAEGLTDSYVFAIVWSRSFTDPLGLTDSFTRELRRPATDLMGLSDDVTVNLYRLEVIPTDNVGLTDSFTTSKTRFQTKTDDTELADSWTLSLVVQRVITDSTGLVDQAVTSLTSSRIQTDSAGLTDAASVNLIKSLVITDGVGLADTAQTPVVFSRTISDSTGLRDTGTISQTHGRVVDDSMGLTDVRSGEFRRTVDDPMSLSDAATSARNLNRTFSDSAGLADSVARFASYVRNITDSAGLSDPRVVDVPTQRDWQYEIGRPRRTWSFLLAGKSWEIGDLSKAWRMHMVDNVVEVTAVNPEDIEVTIFGSENGLPVNPTVSDQVHFAFLSPDGVPGVGTSWVAGSWAVTPQEGNLPDLYKGICTVSGLAIGRYSIWVRVTHGAKKPTEPVGVLIVK